MFKKLNTYILLIFCCFSIFVFSQKTENKFSIELNTGLTFKIDSSSISRNLFYNNELAGRYMLNPFHGIKVDVGINSLRKDINYSSFTKTLLLRYSLQYVFDFGRYLKFEKFSNRFSGLFHIGVGISNLKYKESKWFKSWKNNLTDEQLNFIFGISPQYKLSKKLEVHLDLSYVGNLYQNFDAGFKWSDLGKKSIYGNIYNFSIGASYYIGKNEEHVDWKFKNKSKSDPIEKISDNKENLIVLDRDFDGVVDSLDLCPDEKGLVENSGCPIKNNNLNCEIIENPIVLFNLNNAVVSDDDKKILINFATCLNLNPTVKLILHGHTDNAGEQVAIEDISFRRALNVKKVLTENGVDKDRLVIMTDGIKKAAIPDEKFQTFKHNRLVWFENISNNFYDVRKLNNQQKIEKLFFTVQIGSFEKQTNFKQFETLGEVLITPSPDKTTKVSINIYNNLEEALSKLNEIKSKNLFPDAFVTAYYLGDRINIKQAKLLIEEKGNVIFEISK